jgi:hypothetical protein
MIADERQLRRQFPSAGLTAGVFQFISLFSSLFSMVLFLSSSIKNTINFRAMLDPMAVFLLTH